NPSLGGLTDPKLQEYAHKIFSKEMNITLDGADIVSSNKNEVVIKSGEKTFTVDKVFLAMGRKSNLDRLNLEALDLKWTDKKIPVYDEHTFNITGTQLYIAGDVNAD